MAVMRPFKFVGGPWDGEYHEVDGQDFIDVHTLKNLKQIPYIGDGMDDFRQREVTKYTLRHIESSGELLFCYADSKWSDLYVISQLIHHYPGR